jgi:hypothetical protein
VNEVTNPFGLTPISPASPFGQAMTPPTTSVKKNLIRLEAGEFFIEVTNNLDGVEACIQLLEKMRDKMKEVK